VALSIAEAEYVAIGSCCSQFLWIKQQLIDFGIEEFCTLIKCDNTSVTRNPNLYSKANHIEICHHFIRDYVQNDKINVQFIDSKNQLANIFTKPLEKGLFKTICEN